MSGIEPSVAVLLTMMASGTLVLILGFLFLLCTHLAWQRKTRREESRSAFGSPGGGEEGISARDLERPESWIAFRTEDPLKAAAVLGLEALAPAEAPSQPSDLAPGQWFISPALNGWVMCWGSGLADPGENIDRLHRQLMGMAAHFSGLQYFHQNRALARHAWVRVENQQVYRAYAWADRTQWNEGDFTAAERSLDLKCEDYGQPEPTWPPPDQRRVNTLRVPMLAAKWSLDPLFYLRQGSGPGLGFIGVSSQRHSH